nr:nitrate reductase delta subunit [uncultured euryarchaeote]
MALAEISEGVVPSQVLLDALGIDRSECQAINALLVGELPPFASIYLSLDGNIGGESQAEIAGFYRALSVKVPPNPDYLSSMLYLLGQIIKKEVEFFGRETPRSRAIEVAKLTLVQQHLAPWLVPYLLRAEQVAGADASVWVALTLELIASILESSEVPFPQQTIHADLDQRQIESFANSVEFIGWITSPRLSGVIVAPSDLANIAKSLGLATRIGRKRFVLEGLVQQGGRELLAAIGHFVSEQRDLYLSRSSEFEVLQSWSKRAITTHKRVLATLAP